MNGSNYPPGVSGSEPQIIGTGMEDKCQWCVNEMEEGTPVDSIADGAIEVNGERVCEECIQSYLENEGISFSDIKHLGKEELVADLKVVIAEHEYEHC